MQTRPYEWLVIGGGPQGIALAGALLRSGRCARPDLGLLDAGPSPLWAWRRRAASCGMRMLRSDVRFHLDCWPEPIPYTLADWAEMAGIPGQVHLLDEEHHHLVASTALFNAHCDWFARQYGLEQIWRQGRATALEWREGQGWTVQTADGATLFTRRLVLATGQHALNYPAWATSISPLYHLLDLECETPDWASFRHVTVVGGGLTGANFALWLAAGKSPEVTLLLRHPLKTSLLEADLATLEEPFQRQFRAAAYPARRQMIQDSRNNGTIPPLVLERLERAGVNILYGEVTGAAEEGNLYLRLADGRVIVTGAVALGTGFARAPRDPLLAQLIEKYAAPLSPCGNPTPSPSLEWLPGLYLLGGLAELELGPVCRNLAGAGQGVARIMQSGKD